MDVHAPDPAERISIEVPAGNGGPRHAEILVQAFPCGTNKTQVSTTGGTLPSRRADGKELFYRSTADRVMAVPIDIAGTAPSVGQALTRDTKLNRDVALKILPASFATDPDRLARFHREAQVLASLNHPNIGAIYGVEDSGDTHALVLELVEGPTLADRIAQGPIPVDEALAIAMQIAAALEAAHEQLRFFLAVSGMMIPPIRCSCASTRFTRTGSRKGRTFIVVPPH